MRIRIRVLELLGDGPLAVPGLRAEVGVQASSLPQQLAVLRRAGIVTSTCEGGAVRYTLAGPDVADLINTTLGVLAQVLAGRAERLDAVRDDPGRRRPARRGARATSQARARAQLRRTGSEPAPPVAPAHDPRSAPSVRGGRPTRWHRRSVRRGTPTSH
ncbi:ArsR family transcriptional regulator [Dactylosporangium sp. NPDC049140]|uniref:ArsR/SmtB family transcription factor n=1 Tax=Dactylosporangium sp. NPDC049140 TaxID=3155647 RepID=UPI0033FF6E69